MDYRRLGDSGLEVSVVGLGSGNNFGARIDREQTEEVIGRAVDLGINLIDTANIYGNRLSEEYIGKSIQGIRHQMVLATKVAMAMGEGPNTRGASRKHILEQVERSLTKLGTDFIDLYQLHESDPITPIEETMRTLDDLVRQGKVRYIGCSNFAAWEVARAMETACALNLEPFISVQPAYNLLGREPEEELLPCCGAYGLGILPYYPLAEGFLTGKYGRGQPPSDGTRLAGKPDSAQALLTAHNFALLERLEQFASRRGHTVAELAVAWLLANPLVGSVIAGATKAWQVEDNVKASEWKLTPEDLREVEDALTGEPRPGPTDVHID